MKIIVFLKAFLLLYTYSFSQGTNNIIIKQGQDLTEAYKFIYRYPQFQYGKAYFIKGDVSAGKLNYNFLTGTMQFIDAKGDTLELANESELNFVSIEADTFFYKSKAYVEQLADYTVTKLLLKQSINLSEEKIGAFGIPSSTKNIDTKNTLIAYQNHKLQVNGNLNLLKQRFYYFSNADFEILPVNKKNLLKVFAKQKDKVEKYLKENNTDLNNADDLGRLFTYLKEIIIYKPYPSQLI